MTKNEMAAIITIIDTTYPNHFARLDAQGLDMVVDMWTSVFEAYTAEQVLAALKQFMMTNTSGFGPVPGQLVQYIHAPEDDADLNESEAWALVCKAASNGIYHASEEYEKLPPLVQKAVGTAYVLHEMAMQEMTSVDESNFKRTYRAELERERTKRRLPPSTRNVLERRDDDDAMALPVGN